LRETRLGTQALRFQRLDLPQRLIEVFLRRLRRRFLLMQLGRELLGILNGAPAVLRQFLVAVGLLLCKYERGAPQRARCPEVSNCLGGFPPITCDRSLLRFPEKS
jgi:hypothetical protein